MNDIKNNEKGDSDKFDKIISKDGKDQFNQLYIELIKENEFDLINRYHKFDNNFISMDKQNEFYLNKTNDKITEIPSEKQFEKIHSNHLDKKSSKFENNLEIATGELFNILSAVDNLKKNYEDNNQINSDESPNINNEKNNSLRNIRKIKEEGNDETTDISPSKNNTNISKENEFIITAEKIKNDNTYKLDKAQNFNKDIFICKENEYEIDNSNNKNQLNSLLEVNGLKTYDEEKLCISFNDIFCLESNSESIIKRNIDIIKNNNKIEELRKQITKYYLSKLLGHINQQCKINKQKKFNFLTINKINNFRLKYNKNNFDLIIVKLITYNILSYVNQDTDSKRESVDKGTKIESNLYKIIEQNKLNTLADIVNSKIEKEDFFKNISDNNNSLVNYYFNKWRINSSQNPDDVEKLLKKSCLKNINKKFDKLNDKIEQEKAAEQFVKNINNILLKNYFNKLKNKYHEDNNTGGEDKIPDLSLIRNKLYVAVFKRVKMDEKEIGRYNNLIKSIIYIIKKNIAKNLFDFSKNTHIKDVSDENIPDLSLIRNKLHVSVFKKVKMNEEEIENYNYGIKNIIYVIKKNIAKNLFDFSKNDQKKEKSNENIPDLSLIRSKLRVSVVKRVKMNEKEVENYKSALNSIAFIIRISVSKYLFSLLNKIKK